MGGDFCYTSLKIGGGSDPSVKNVTLFFLMKASLNVSFILRDKKINIKIKFIIVLK